mgnify:CR=1 FL=1|tara:strand:- start:121 stop:861 length:741 start_codon:yes stop_codon:yes gene_type:complete
MRSKILVSLLLLLSISLPSQACSCIGPTTFLKSVNIYGLELKFIGTDSLTRENYLGDKYKSAVKKLVLIDIWWQPEDAANTKLNVSDTLYLLEGNGANCFGFLPDATYNEHYLISLDLSVFREGVSDEFKGANKPIISTSLCTEPILWLDGDRAKGHISKNKKYRKRAFADRFFKFAQHYREKSYQFEKASFGHKYYDFWSQAGERAANFYLKVFSNNGNYFEGGQNWSRKRLRKMALKVRASQSA